MVDDCEAIDAGLVAKECKFKSCTPFISMSGLPREQENVRRLKLSNATRCLSHLTGSYKSKSMVKGAPLAT